MENLPYISEIITSTMCLLMGIMFIAIPVPQNKYLHNYRISLKVLSADYIAMSVLNVLFISYVWDKPFDGYFNFISTLICSSQAFLCAFAMLNLLDLQFITRKKLYQNCLPLIGFSVAYVICRLVFGNYEIQSLSQLEQGLLHPTMAVRMLFFVYYAAQLCYYSYLFSRAARKLRNEIENYFSDTHQLRQGMYLNLFRGLIVFGTVALVFLLLPFPIFNFILSILTNIFYFVFAILFINYTRIFIAIEPAITGMTESDTNELTETAAPAARPARLSELKWNNLKRTIINERYHLEEQITLEELAQKIGIGRTSLSNFINTEENLNFYGWINFLRVEHAKVLLRENSEYTIAQIAQQTGFTETSNFSRAFKNIAGSTPSDWRKTNL